MRRGGGMARMFHPGNGRDVFGLVNPEILANSQVKVTKAIVKAMLRRETELRFSLPVQVAYAKTEGCLSVTDDLQLQVAKEFGFEDLAEGIDILRSAEARFPDDQEIKDLSNYRKYNRAKEGVLQTGDEAPNSLVFTLDGCSTSLLEYAKMISSNDDQVTKRQRTQDSSDKPLLLVGGSYS